MDEIRKRVAALHERRAELILLATDGAKAGADIDLLLRMNMQAGFHHRKYGYERPESGLGDGYSGFGVARPVE